MSLKMSFGLNLQDILVNNLVFSVSILGSAYLTVVG
jgi:hypothetical protein